MSEYGFNAYVSRILHDTADLTRDSRARLVFVSALLTCIVAYSYAAANPIWVPDDFAWQLGRWESRHVDGAGRWALRLWGELTHWQPLPVFSWAIAIISYSLTGVLIGRHWGVRGQGTAILIAMLFVAYPGFIEESRWDLVVAPFALAHLLVVVAISLSRRSLTSAVLAGGLLTISIAIYQSLISFAIVLILLSISLSIARSGVRAVISDAQALVVRPMITGIMGIIAYFLSLMVYVMTGRTLGRGIDNDPVGGVELLHRITDGGTRLLDFLSVGLDDFYGSYLVALILLQAFVLLVGSLIVGRRYWHVIGAMAVTVLAMIAVFSHQYVAPDIQASGWEARAATGLSLLMPFMLALSESTAGSGNAVRRIPLVLGTLLAINWAAYAGNYAYQAHLQTLKVTMDANRILERVQSNPDFNSSKPIVFPYGYNFAWYQYDANRTSNEFLHFFYNLKVKTTDAQITQAQDRAKSMGYWPAANSVAVLSDMAIVVVDTPLADSLRSGLSLGPASVWKRDLKLNAE